MAYVPAPVLNTPAHQKLSGRTALLHDLYEIYLDHQLPRFAPPGVKVYHARSLRGGAFLAYACERVVTPRIQMAEKYSGLQSTSVMRLAARGVMEDEVGAQRYAFIYENNVGNPIVAAAGEPVAYGWKTDQVLEGVLRPVASVLLEMHNHDLVHGNIRATNLFNGGSDPVQSVIVGDCLTTPYLAAQPALYLPPSLAIATPTGRGLGSWSDDLYALGVTCAVLLRTHDTTSAKSDEELYIAKTEMGTLSTLIEHERLAPNILELLRGLLHDDPLVRWSIIDVFEWFEGKRAGHKQSGNRRLKASRHIIVGGRKVLIPSLFGYYATQDPVESAKLVDNGEIKQWIRRSISDAKLEERYDMAVESNNPEGAAERSSNFQDRLMARVAMAMAPDYPIMYRQTRLFHESIGNVLAELMALGKDTKPITDILTDQAINFSMNMQDEVPSDYNLVTSRIEACLQFLRHKSVGYGIERCLYFLAPDCPCLSINLKGFFVHTPEDLVRALNTIAARPDRPERILDRHMMAFLSVRDRKVIDHVLPDLNAPEPHRYIFGVIAVLSSIQAQSRMPAMPDLSSWIYTLAEPLYDRYHDRDVRSMLRKKMNELKDEGMLQKINDLMFNNERQRRDQFEYKLASKEYTLLKMERRGLVQALKDKESFGTGAGHEIAALLAGIFMALAVTGFVVMRFTQGGTTLPW